jgi:DNA-directed RNA polymerase subunit K/omega
VVRRPIGMNPFEFSVVSSLRAAQLLRGCIPLVDGPQKMIMTAQLEVAAGKISKVIAIPDER